MAFFVCLLLGVALPHRPGAELQGSGLFLHFMCAPLHVLVVLQCVVVGAFVVFVEFFQCFSPFLLSLYFTLFSTMHHYGCLLFIFIIFPLSSWLCVMGAWVRAGFGGWGSWLGCG